MALVIIDFDYTIVQGHTNNILQQESTSGIGRPAAWEVVKKIEPIGGAKEWLKTFRQLMADGHQIAIASFNNFGYIIPKYLEEKIRLTTDELGKIHYEAWLPEKPETANKNQHIKNIKKIFEFKEPTNEQVIVIDDQDRNLEAAGSMGCTVIKANAEGSHLPRIQQFSKLYKKASYGELIEGYGRFSKPDAKTRRIRIDPAPEESNSSCIIL